VVHCPDTIAKNQPAIQEQIGEICSGGPGPELAGLLREAATAGCPVWHSVDGIVLPRMLWTSNGHEPRLPRRLLDPIVLALVEHGSQRVFDIACETPKARTQIKRLTAAMYCDLLGMSEPDAADVLGYGSVEEHWTAARRARGLHNVACEGRVLWAHLGAWPWWGQHYWFGRPPGPLPSDLSLPSDWWQNEEAQEALVVWCAARLPYPLPATPALASPAIYPRSPPGRA
jgi:hypothetical protein